MSAGTLLVVAIGYWVVPWMVSQPLLVLVIPIMLISAKVAWRWPVPTVIAVFAGTGFFGTIGAYLHLSVPQLEDVFLTGLWLGALWAFLFRARERPLLLWPGIACALAYVAITLFQALGSESLDMAFRAARVSAWYMLAFLLVAIAPWSSPEARTRLARGFVVVAGLVGLYATYRWIFGQAGTEVDRSVAASTNEVLNSGDVRLFGSLITGKQLAFWAAMSIPFSLACALAFHGRWKLIAGAAVGLCGVAMFGADVRVAVVAAVPAILIVLALYQGSRAFTGLHLGSTLAATLIIALLAVGAFALTLGGESTTGQRYSVLLESPTSDKAYQDRVFKWRTAVHDASEHPLGQGIGSSGEIQKRFGRYKNISNYDVDSSYLKVALEQGFGVMGLFIVALLLLTFGLGRRALMCRDPLHAALGIGATGTLIVMAVFFYAGTYVEGIPVLGAWLIVGLGSAGFVQGAPAESPQGLRVAAHAPRPEPA